MPGSDLLLLIEAAHEAGRIATAYVGGPLEVQDKAGGAGPVTAADLAVNAMLVEQLRSARPEYGWLSEETEDTAARLQSDRVFIVDPIDGTRSFIEGNDSWAHSLAVSEGGVVIAAAIYLPMRDKLYAAAVGQGATLNGVPIRATGRADLVGASILASKPNYAPEHWLGGRVPDVTRAFRPSLAYRLGLVAEGRYDAMMTLRPSWEWDIAAGDLILREAGAVTSDRHAGPLRFNNPVPMVNGVLAANPVLHSALHAALAG
ncbi:MULTISPECIES: inositol monophosphatase family protein [unclassified Roseovarius]|uniref:inositol monophosphatase family protein n=1 Tax=unclassified Roseovarius TaxID=2614913 RepID=UPI0000685D27|nr:MULTISPECIES: 3'(2'),5'-bisphosphate nucleotidase CysQ [unclassified Roseovarius]EAQ26155.1 inositol monophosphatase family protein [Roseovarius sp. 217]KJS45435.1 MAG: inositol monophosphatase [Roseovarius sp. BRH_c41]